MKKAAVAEQRVNIKILLIDDHEIVRQGLQLFLNQQDGIYVTGEASRCQDAIALVQQTSPNVVLLNLNTEVAGSLDCLHELRVVNKHLRVLVMLGQPDADMQYAAMCNGAMGAVSKSDSVELIVKAIRAVHAGEAWFDGAVIARMIGDLQTRAEGCQCTLRGDLVMPGAPLQGNNHGELVLDDLEREIIENWRRLQAELGSEHQAQIASLTAREREIISLVGKGLRNQQIADRLYISVITVRHHLSSIFSKLDVEDRFELAIYAYKHRLAPLPIMAD